MKFFVVALLYGTLGFAKGTVHKVKISGMAFNPASIEIQKGDSIEWNNDDIVPHTVTSEKNFDSKNLDPGKTYKHSFKKAGVFPYHCMYHPVMKATVTVK